MYPLNFIIPSRNAKTRNYKKDKKKGEIVKPLTEIEDQEKSNKIQLEYISSCKFIRYSIPFSLK